MAIHFEETMGAVGIVRKADVALEDLPEELRPMVDRLLEVPSIDDPSLRDAGLIKLAAEGGSICLRTWEIPAEVAPLIAFLRHKARPSG